MFVILGNVFPLAPIVDKLSHKDARKLSGNAMHATVIGLVVSIAVGSVTRFSEQNEPLHKRRR